MEIRHLRAFAALAREKSFTRAAASLRVAQPAVSQQIRALEQELGVVLIERSNRTGALTEAGQALLARAERVLAEVHDAAEEMAAHAGLRRGVVRLGCALQTLLETTLPPLFAAFRARYPEVRIAVRELHTRQILRLLARGEVELGLVHLGRVEGGRLMGGESASPDLALKHLRREPLVALVATGHRLAGRARLRVAALRDEPFVAFQPGATVRLLVAEAAARHGFEPQIAFSTANLGTVKAMVAAGLGVAVVPLSALDAPGPPLRAIELDEPRLERVVVLARNKARYEGPAAAAVRRALSDAI